MKLLFVCYTRTVVGAFILGQMFTSVYTNSPNMRTGYNRRAQNRAANRKGGPAVKKIDYPHPKALEICFKVE